MAYNPTLGAELCEALGLNPNETTAIRLEIGVDDLMRAEVSHVYFDAPRLVDVLKHYMVVERPWGPPLPPPQIDRHTPAKPEANNSPGGTPDE